MGKVKIHEIAKRLGIPNKEVLDIANQNGIEAKSHLSAITEEEENKLEKLLIKGESKKKSMDSKKETKKEEPVIIRRAVIINDDDDVKKDEKKKEDQKRKNNVGFVDNNNRKKDYNIVYRDKPTRPLTVSELLGIGKKENKKEEAKKEEAKKEEVKKDVVKKEVVEIKKEEIKKEVVEIKKEEKVLKEVKKEEMVKEVNSGVTTKKVENSNIKLKENTNNTNIQSRNNYNKEDRNRNNYNKDNRNAGYNKNNNYNKENNFGRDNKNNSFNKDGKNNFVDRRNNPNYNKNDDNRNSGNFRNNKTLDEKGIDKKIKNIMEIEMPEKENVREYANKVRDKQKMNSKSEERQPKKNKKGGHSDFDTDKLKSLKKQNKLSNMFNEGEMLDYYDLSTERGRRGKKVKQKQEERVKQKIFKLTEITIPETITVKDLAMAMKVTSGDVIKKLLSLGTLATINNELDFDTAFLIAQEYGITAVKKNIVTDEDKIIDETEDLQDELVSRPPVIVVMGHVDHGKTSLLDAIRSTNVIEGESGGITQHIGAYQVKINDREITFLDTPGHEAFTSMRARGAMITDIAILVVAANDGVMPQTVEAINHAKAAEIPIIVAVNKMDLPDANFARVQQELMQYELVPEEWGGNTIYVPISAKKNQGIDNLLEMVLLQADMLELKANPKKQAKGTIIEARLDKTRGPVASMLVQRGTLDVGDTIIVGSTIGRIRTMKNDKGKNVKSAGPSTPVEITGLNTVPQSGETFYEVKDEKTAKHLIERRKREAREKELAKNRAVSLDDLFNQIESQNLKQLNLIVKADVQGSVEALKQSLEKLSNNEVKVRVIHSNVGGVTETDVTLAKVSNAIIIGFNVRAEVMAKTIADNDGVEIKTYSIIYDAINDVEAAMKGMLDPVFKEVIIGTAEIRQTFKVSNVGTIAGCYVLSGKVSRNAGLRVIRDNIVIHDGKLISLKRFKDDVKEVDKGYECGLQIDGFNDIKEGDTLEVYIMEEVK
ncbi:MAG: translation initiation factor IF-2 [Clostridia bacterium]|nr:translation initiation factor IF-2 [Clostridia bacterium]